MCTSSIRQLLPAIAVAAMLAANSSLAGTVITTATGNGADVSLQNDSQNGGTSATVFNGFGADFRRSDTSRSKAVLLRFDISTLTGDLNDAMLSFDYNHNRSRDLQVYGLSDETLDSWDEGSTSYSNAPVVLQPGDGGDAYDSGLFSVDPAKTTSLGLVHIEDTRGFLPNARGLASSNTTDLPLGTFLGSDTNGIVTFLLIHSGSDTAQTGSLATKENTASLRFPTLSTTPVPEPASVAFLSLGVLAILGLRHRM